MPWWHWALIIAGAVTMILIVVRLVVGEGAIWGILEVVGEVLGGIADDK
jgi:hypothetical protein